MLKTFFIVIRVSILVYSGLFYAVWRSTKFKMFERGNIPTIYSFLVYYLFLCKIAAVILIIEVS